MNFHELYVVSVQSFESLLETKPLFIQIILIIDKQFEIFDLFNFIAFYKFKTQTEISNYSMIIIRTIEIECGEIEQTNDRRAKLRVVLLRHLFKSKRIFPGYLTVSLHIISMCKFNTSRI